MNNNTYEIVCKYSKYATWLYYSIVGNFNINWQINVKRFSAIRTSIYIFFNTLINAFFAEIIIMETFYTRIVNWRVRHTNNTFIGAFGHHVFNGPSQKMPVPHHERNQP
mmetsp:Transcript_22813/g.65157  ORF Transcript_22813/g.65157 Transcript_22813/m.65157 type:complete len:109 (-) Transcript_22813:6711-7037(-)